MKTYVVGGAVRDRLLGLPVEDRDHVVVGASPEQMIALGFTPVGRDFPVFLHPVSHEEYALARTERKVAPGYAGFAFFSDPDVTLEEDLQRRDLTINAMALTEDGQLVDPYGGERDLRDRVFRHVSDSFIEDPVRILRLARFAARFSEFSVAPETQALMSRMVELGEVDALVAERVWQELSRGLMQAFPSRMLQILIDCAALTRIAPELGQPDSVRLGQTHVLEALDRMAATTADLPMRFAIWMRNWPWPAGPDVTIDSPDRSNRAKDAARLPQDETLGGLDALCVRWRIPGDCRALATLALREGDRIEHAGRAAAEDLLGLLNRTDAFRKPERFKALLVVIRLSAESIGVQAATAANGTQRAQQALDAAAAVDAGEVARRLTRRAAPATAARGDDIRAAVDAARLQAIANALGQRQ